MRHNTLSLFGILLSLVLFNSIAQACPEHNIEDIQVNAIDGFSVQAQNVVILDVRTPEEYAISHIEEAININIADDNFADDIAKLNRDKTYIVHCAANVAGGRTEQSFEIMTDLGFKNLRNMAGGIVAWEANGLPLIRNE